MTQPAETQPTETQPTDRTELPLEDALEQQRDLTVDDDTDDTVVPASLPGLDVPDADYVEQQRDVPLDDDGYERD
ncbi:hypothetical protein [Rhodococcoides corynebacterioides]|uniref:Uncharacterized protein n=1 Tax=Rhodococcoides corynebacterioides TaxID=53972 RepID=A0ABS7P421_9NOCA|nr:hypothetical protein [Rhodococcus corynebacterioides]MBY6367172.1 hypothetical protein [Rhodococcus corynebacterioides]MBY6407414.1 hypothetical protein [Rhodococcus corynebacterioides]